MTLIELVTILKSAGYPVAYSHFDSPPALPYIAYIDDESTNFNADNIVYYSVKNPTIELYTNKKDLNAESALETALNDSELPFELISEVYIESERMFQRSYSISVI
ncbi:hypothetical protein HMI01_10840 [Halolactibacillus miurensis]|uniref:Prophage pi2 protein 38 n=1 Tax=Halolactibacillus miurensis TaxID=306541 RepID=A0A1I6SHJ8_9BACI|nr:hypothetical protein [Halolactibacillus miurensis]GEM04096.1 hypothetical protein HMI01_10840 [Halolactibacillus miurensis]SFS76445.1 hypothetical protein SAMN05421668_10958 [Halolactibacillus miurensis]